jgi:hypothetical protein
MLSSRPSTSRINSQGRIRSICQRSTTSVDADTDTADQIAHSDRQSRPEQRISGVVVTRRVYIISRYWWDLGGKDDGHDDAVDSDDFAEDNGDEIFGPDSRCLYATADDGGTGDENAPIVIVRFRLWYCICRRCALRIRTRQRRRRIGLCRGQCPYLPMRTARCFRERLRPGGYN